MNDPTYTIVWHCGQRQLTADGPHIREAYRKLSPEDQRTVAKGCVHITVDGMPTSEQMAAVEAFRKKYSPRRELNRLGARNWKDALMIAWSDGWDAYEPGGHHLRSIRNDPRTHHRWLKEEP
jgi:hypothetical protein